MVDTVDLEFSSGIPELDDILQNVLAGDNVVLQIDEIEDYIPFIHAFCRNVNREKKDLIYFRFAQHDYLLPEDVEATVYELNPKKGFDYPESKKSGVGGGIQLGNPLSIKFPDELKDGIFS